MSDKFEEKKILIDSCLTDNAACNRKNMYKRIHVLVLDSVGCGGAADAKDYGDQGANTLRNISEKTMVKLPSLQKMGLGNICELPSVPATDLQKGYVTYLREQSAGKDTMTGHWELMGIISQTPFPTYPNGFDNELLKKISLYSGR